MELVLILGLLLTAIGVLVGLYLPFVVPQFCETRENSAASDRSCNPGRNRKACEVFAVWPVEETEIEQQTGE